MNVLDAVSAAAAAAARAAAERAAEIRRELEAKRRAEEAARKRAEAAEKAAEERKEKVAAAKAAAKARAAEVKRSAAKVESPSDNVIEAKKARAVSAKSTPADGFGAPADGADPTAPVSTGKIEEEKPKPKAVPFFSQLDSKWSGDPLGSKTVGSIGCAMTSTAMALSAITGKTVTPKELNKNRPYSGNSIMWDQAAKSVDPSLSMSNASLTPDNIKKSLEKGAPVVIQVDHSGDGATDHWIAITGMKEKDGKPVYSALDPAADPSGKGAMTMTWDGSKLTGKSPGGKQYTTSGDMRVITGGKDAPSRANGLGTVGDEMKIVEGKGLNESQMTEIFKGIDAKQAKEYLPYLNAAMKEFKIEKPDEVAAFCAQLSHESGGLKWFEELASGEAYEGRVEGLGNTEPGDGKRFKGRGPIQLTGRANYKNASEALGVDLIADPKAAASKEVGFRSAGWFWSRNNLSDKLASGGIDAVSKAVNGGTNGLQNRRDEYARISKIIGNGDLGTGPVATNYEKSGTYTASETGTGSGGGGGGGSVSASSAPSGGSTSSSSPSGSSASSNDSSTSSTQETKPSDGTESSTPATPEEKKDYSNFGQVYGGEFGLPKAWLAEQLEKMFGTKWVQEELPKDTDFRNFVRKETGGKDVKNLSKKELKKLEAKYLAQGIKDGTFKADSKHPLNAFPTPPGAAGGTDDKKVATPAPTPGDDGAEASDGSGLKTVIGADEADEGEQPAIVESGDAFTGVVPAPSLQTSIRA